MDCKNGKKIKVTVNDRGPFIEGRILDVSVAAAHQLGFYKKGLTRIRLTTLVKESLALGKRKRPPLFAQKKSSQGKKKRTYVKIKTSSLGKALGLECELRCYGPTDVKKIPEREGFEVVVGPLLHESLVQRCQERARYLCNIL